MWLYLRRRKVTDGNWPGPGCPDSDCQRHVTPFYPKGYLAGAFDEAEKKQRQHIVDFYGQDARRVCRCCVPNTLVDTDCRYLVQIGHKYW